MRIWQGVNEIGFGFVDEMDEAEYLTIQQKENQKILADLVAP